jgi:hypothetical protein
MESPFATQQMMSSAGQGIISTSAKSNYKSFVIDALHKEQAKTIVRSVIWYFGWPLFFFIILAPGFLISLPPAVDCDDGVRKPIAPERTTVANVFLHSVIFIVLIIFMYWYGAKHLGIYFPFTAKSIEASLA